MSDFASLMEITGVPPGYEAYGEEKHERVGFFTDTSVCIGCKACEVACKEWNQLPAELDAQHFRLSGNSYDNTVHLSGRRRGMPHACSACRRRRT